LKQTQLSQRVMAAFLNRLGSSLSSKNSKKQKIINLMFEYLTIKVHMMRPRTTKTD